MGMESGDVPVLLPDEAKTLTIVKKWTELFY